jgi:dTDP-glucose 4,6-dehydratase
MPFNVGSANDVSILELAKVVAATLSPGTNIQVARQAAPGTAPARYVPAVDRARQVLGLREITTLEDSIRSTAAWYSR